MEPASIPGYIVCRNDRGPLAGERNEEVAMEKHVRRILVLAMDIGNSREALRCGVSLARNLGAELSVLHVVHDPFGAKGWNLPFLSIGEAYKNVLREAKEDLEKLIRKENEKGLQIREMVREGEPLGVVFKVLKENQIDLLVVPAHEEGRLEHFLFGRTTETIIRTMPCSVLLVKTEQGF
jgi:universal stress protein A